MSWLRVLGILLYRLGWQPGDAATPGELVLGRKLAEQAEELRLVTLEKKALEDELRVTRLSVDLLTALVARERQRIQAETDWFGTMNRERR